MLISSQSNQMIFQFPVDFIEDYLYDRFQDILDKNHYPYENVLDFLNSTIKEINFPGMTYDNAVQTKWKSKKVEWKNTANVFDTFNRDLEVVFRSVESHINYFMMVQIMTEFYLNNDKHYMPYFTVGILDKTGDLMMTLVLKNILLKGLSEIRMAYQAQDVQEKTFTLSFKYVWLDIFWETKRHPLSPDQSIFQLPKYSCKDNDDYGPMPFQSSITPIN